MFQTKAIQFVQNRHIFYSVVLPAGKIIEMSKVDAWDPDNPMSGYQRVPSAARKREIGMYALKSDSIMPVGGLLNARDSDQHDGGHYGSKLKFEPEYKDGHISFGLLTIPDEALPLYIVDMQHRIGGYEWAIEQEGGERLEDFPLVATIADGLSKMEEVDQFDIINTTQKKVRTDLARRLKAIQATDVDHMLAMDKRGKLWEAKGPVIAEKLNNGIGPWAGKILPPNRGKEEQPTMVVRETSFVTSLKPILQTPYFIRQSEEAAAELITRFWVAIQRVWPEAFENPDEYVIQKSPGVFSLHELAPEVFEMVRDSGEITVENIFKVVKSLGEIGGSEFWEANNSDGAASYGSMKGFRFLASDLRQFLPKIN